MNKKFVIGITFLSISILLIAPSINAIEYREVTEIANIQYQKSKHTIYSRVSDNFMKMLIDLLIEIVIFIVDLIDNILVFFAIIFTGWGHRDPPGLMYYVTYLLHLINLFIGKLLINILNFISSLLDDKIGIINDNKHYITFPEGQCLTHAL